MSENRLPDYIDHIHPKCISVQQFSEEWREFETGATRIRWRRAHANSER